MYNFYYAIHLFCNDDDIVLDYDGDDWFRRDDALKIINAAYEDPNVWLTYGNFLIFPGDRRGFCCECPARVREKGSYRKFRWFSSHQKTFYAWLFKKIEIEDLMYEGDFVKASVDPAYMFPMLEMTGGKFKFIRDVICTYNRQCINTDNEMKELQGKESSFNRGRESYQRLDDPVLGETIQKVSMARLTGLLYGINEHCVQEGSSYFEK